MQKILTVIVMTAVLWCSIVPVSANSLPAYWEAVTLEGVTVVDEDCPIEVQKEKLVFNITDFLKEDYKSIKSFLEYESNMNAEYTFYNPTDKDITAKLLFPMGNIPENALYVTEEDNIWPYDLDKYDVLVNDEVIDKKVRHIYMGEGSVFKAKQALGKIENDYVENEFYTPDLPVTKYTYKIEDLGKDDGWYLDIKMKIPKWNEKTKYLFPSIWEWNINEKDKMATIEESVFADETYDIYVLGENVEPVLTAEITEYEENEILDAKFIVEKTEQMTFLEFVKFQNDER